MISLLACIALGDLTAARFFPLVPGTHWVYTDSDSGTTIEQVVKPEVIQTPDTTGDATTTPDPAVEHLPNYYPIEETDDGQVSSSMPCYIDRGNRVYLVGMGINRPVSQRLVVVVTKEPYSWTFYGTAISPLQTESIKYECTSEVGPSETILGAKHDTVIVKFHATLGKKGKGLDVNQTWKYASDIGLYELDEVGKMGDHKVDHVRKLVKFVPGSTTPPGSKA